MTKEEEASKEFISAFDNLIENLSIGDALSVATGCFVGLAEAAIKHSGNDSKKEIKIDGGKNRDITIHASKGNG